MNRLLSSPLLTAAGFRHGFSLRTGGVSASPFDSLNLGRGVGDDPLHVQENLARFLGDLEMPPERLATVHQVHGDAVVTARLASGRVVLEGVDGGASEAVQADALVGLEGAAVGVRTADCVPILLADPVSGAVAAIHAGWRGTVAKIVLRAIEQLVERTGAAPERLIAAIGPCIGPCCFAVGDEVADRFASDSAFGASLVDRTGAQPHVDLVRANRRLLEAAGLQADRIDIVAPCTVCDRERFFSHRRDAGRTGRHLSVIASRV